MKTEDVRKALEQCGWGDGSCVGCPLEDELGCRQKLLEYAMETIHRQEAEIERLNGNLIEEQTRRKNAVDSYHAARKAGIKEFWERLQKEFPGIFAKIHPCTLSEIDYLVEEMTGEQP